MAKNIMLAFVSPVSAWTLNAPIKYPDICGRPYAAIQTNESAIVYVQRMLSEAGESLSKIFLIVSESVKSGKVQPENEFGDVTHLEFLTRRIAKEFPQLAERFSIQDYSEEGAGSTKLETNILQTAGIADAVTDFANQFADEKVIVHADMTGGFRHTSMLMLSIIQLLKYRGVETGEVLYSEPGSRVVYRMTEIQRMFSLITGADEFVKFGSVEALNEYFGKNPPPAVKALLEAMNRFSDAIKICRTSAIEAELVNLGKHIKTFRERPDKDLKSELFAKIIDTIEREYGHLIDGSASRLEIIRWCMRKDFWQQAMTLCTEWLPEEIVARKICVPNSSYVKKTAELEGRQFGRNWQQHFIIAYQGTDKFSDKGEVTKEFCRKLRHALENLSAREIPDENPFGELKTFFDEYDAAEIPFALCCRGGIKVGALKNKLPLFSAALQAVYDERNKSRIYKDNFNWFLRSLDYRQIPQLVANLPAEKLFELFKIDREAISAENIAPAEKSASKWKNREQIYRDMFSKQIICSAFDEPTALKFLHDYYELRRERNQVNHANAHATKKISELKTMIDSCLDALDKLPK